jgi:hypothetical protein
MLPGDPFYPLPSFYASKFFVKISGLFNWKVEGAEKGEVGKPQIDSRTSGSVDGESFQEGLRSFDGAVRRRFLDFSRCALGF